MPHWSNQALCDSVHPVGVALGGTGQWGYKNDYIPHHEPFDYYASTANPHHLAIPRQNGTDTVPGLKTIGRDTQSIVNGVPQFNTLNHNYDTSDFNQLVAAITAGQLPATALPAAGSPTRRCRRRTTSPRRTRPGTPRASARCPATRRR
ncbi:MAG TPA: hypothetical protein VGF81_16025 [Solirubrobacteraceae bacterium]